MTEILSRRSIILLYMSATMLGLMLFTTALEYRKKHEPDPLTVSAPYGVETYAGMREQEWFNFRRLVCTTKDLVVNVHREFVDEVRSRRYLLPAISYGAYAEDHCTDVVFTGRIPRDIEPGWYEYRPILIYNVNDALQVAKEAPMVRVEVVE